MFTDPLDAAVLGWRLRVALDTYWDRYHRRKHVRRSNQLIRPFLSFPFFILLFVSTLLARNNARRMTQS